MEKKNPIVKSLGIILMIVSLFIGLARPINQRIDYLSLQIEQSEKRSTECLKNFKEEIFRTIDKDRELNSMEINKTKEILEQRIQTLEKGE